MLGFNETFRALADPTRRAILAALRRGPLFAGQIAEQLHVPPSALSFHLRVLRTADLVSDCRRGQFIQYTLNTSVVDDVIRFLMDGLGRDPLSTQTTQAVPASDDAQPSEARE